MKYLRLLFIAILFFPLTVFAEEDTLRLLKQDDEIFYDYQYVTKNTFSQSVKIDSKKDFQKKFLVNNETGDKLGLFFLVDTKGQDGTLNDLLDYLQLKILVDGKAIYDGSASVMNSSIDSSMLLEPISLGDFSDKKISNLEVNLHVMDEYFSASNNRFAYIDWTFYIKDSEGEFLEIGPLTKDEFYNYLNIWVFCGFSIGVAGAILFGYLFLKMRKHRKNDKDKKEKKEEGNETNIKE